jgi:hypothetical protein
MDDQDYKLRTRETADFVMLLAATACFLLAYFRVGDSDAVFWLGITFNLMVAFGVTTRK